MTKRTVSIYLILIAILFALVSGWYLAAFLNVESNPVSFNGLRAYEDVKAQVAFGSRSPDTQGHLQTQELIRAELEAAGWLVAFHDSERLGHSIRNVIAKRDDAPPQIILGAHYDTRFVADNDPDLRKRGEPVIGANDGASGVAVLLELARSLPKDGVPVWLVFFDAEDNGNIEGWDWILGSRAFAEEIEIHPRAVVIVDMIGDADLNIYLEHNSDKTIRAEIWSTAAKLGYEDKFINEEKFNMEDDHTPFVEKGIPAVDLIDFDYPYWHTAQDTADKVSAESLEAVGDTLWHWIVELR
ncbi:MAG: M28 family peptidase [Anaerolineales bacterium]|nr:M28 family peptidase [Anaerolineales bacterium]